MHAAVTHFDYFVFAVVVAITPINLGACSTSTSRSVKAVTNSCCTWNHIVYLASMMTVTALCLVVNLPDIICIIPASEILLILRRWF